jgi:hypothetical protein
MSNGRTIPVECEVYRDDSDNTYEIHLAGLTRLDVEDVLVRLCLAKTINLDDVATTRDRDINARD